MLNGKPTLRNQLLAGLLALWMLLCAIPQPILAAAGDALAEGTALSLQATNSGNGYSAEGTDAAKLANLRYDDRYDITGKAVEIVGGEGIVAVENDTLRAVGVGTAMVRIDGQLYDVTVDKAKINIVVIMGQSNAGNHFANATSEVTCAPGTAYWWKNGATEPVDYTAPSMGFHTPLLAELYAQSAAAGDPVKNVMVWQEGVTSKNGQSIVKWAASETDTSGTDGTATMIKNCIAYYEQNCDKFEIVNCGVYWLQGESDVSMSPEKYTGLFMAMWEKLKNAGAKYLAFFRVRCGTTGNTSEHHDLGYTGSLTAQLQMINDNADMFMASTITESWEGNETTEHSVDIRNYLTLMEKYGQENSHNDAYGNAATFEDGILTTTMKTLYGSNNKCHYGKFGYGIIGADAAYNMYHALHTDEFSIVQTDTSGKADAAATSKPGDAVTIDITEMTENLAFRASCGSAAGTLAIKVESGNEDITEKVIANETNTYGTVDTEILWEYDNVVITVMYNPVFGTSGSIVYSIVDNSPEPPKMYFWDFENDLNARDENGEVVNSFGETALNGSYVIENGMLKGNSLQLALGKQLKLCGDENWSIEWKFGEVTTNTTGFLLCNTAKSAIGTKAVYFSIVGNVMVSDYKNSKGYYNYFTEEATFASGDCIKITNTYDSKNGKSVLSLWKNGKLIVSDLQKKGYINSSTYGTYDMSTYPLSGDFVFNYLGCTGLQYFPVTGEIDYLKIIPEEENAESLSLRYDDHYDVTGKTVEIIDAGTPTSYQVGYGVEENAIRDTAVVTLEGQTLVATGIGNAKVRIDGTVCEISVTAAPLSLLLLIGQSNMEGNEGEAKQSIVCPDGMVYATYGDRYDMVLENATHYAPSALTGEYRTINTVGGTDGLCDYPVYMLTNEGDGRKGPDSGFAYEWVKQTGEKVWIVNAAHGGTSLDVWQSGTTQYEECRAMFGACQETLRKEIAAGHFTLSHMAYFWCQGCNDYNKTAEWYVEKYLSMHESLNAEMAFDHDGDAATPAKQFELAGIIPVRAGHSWSNGYRAGTHTDSTNKSSYESFVDLQMTGPRVAQYWMCNNPELKDIVLVCNIGEDWVWMPDGTNGVSAYFNAHYPNGTVDYTTQVQQSASWYKPTTPNAVHDSIHYNQIGYNEVGRESVRNALIYLGINPNYEEETTVKFVDWTGYKEVTAIEAATAGSSGTLVVPIVSPVTRSKTVNYALSEGLYYKYYDLLADSVNVQGQLSAVGTQNSVTVTPRSLDRYTWNFDGTNLISDPADDDINNALTLLGGSVIDGLFNGIRYKLSRSICLNHDREWGMELRISDWSATSGSMIFSGGAAATTGQPYVYFRPADYFVGFGYYDGTQYNNYGVSLKNYGIVCKEGSHTYCFMNRIAADGTNAIWLYVDGEEIAPLTEYYVNSTLTDGNSSDLSGKDFILSYIGTSDFAVKGCVIDGIRVVETEYDPSIHLHIWSAWETEVLPSAKGPGIDTRSCTECGKTQSREVEGVWQKYDLDEHIIDLPEDYCAGTNLWTLLPHDAEYYHSGLRWDTNGDVHSVTFVVSGGEKIFATAFDKHGINGTATSDGIRLTFFGEDGVLKTTSPQETYAEFVANGGYIVVPEGAVAVNVPMYNNSDDNVLYILSRDHTYTSTVTAPTCTEPGYTTHTCACGDSYVDSYVPATGHKFSVYIADGNATYETDGTKTALCDHGCGTKDTVADVGSMLFPEQVTSAVYTISDGILGNVPAGTTVSALLSGLDWGKYCTVFDASGKAVEASAKVATGMVVKLLRGAETKQTLTIAVRGDTNGDGAVTLTDFVQIKAHLLQKQTLTGAAVNAADYSADGSVTATDFMQVKALLLQAAA